MPKDIAGTNLDTNILQCIVGAWYILTNDFLTIKWHNMQDCAIYILV